MNNKGFTLVEMLAVVVILGLVMGIATYGVTNSINKSKDKSEKIFVDKVSTAIEEYLNLYGSSIGKNINDTEYEFTKCYTSVCTDDKSYIATAYELESINISDLIGEKILDVDKAVNPVNNKKCFVSSNPTIRIFKDSDYVYYYYVDLGGTNTDCEISGENGIINTLPDRLKEKVGL